MAKLGGKGQKRKSDLEKSRQKIRTRKNKAMKYKKLIAKLPNDPHKAIWKRKLEHSVAVSLR